MVMAPSMKIVFGLLTFVTFGMIIGTDFPSFMRRQKNGYLQLPRGATFWDNDKEAELLRLGYVKPEVISWLPRILVLHNFLSMEECDYLRAIARPHLQVSTVVDTKTGKGIKSNVRTSSGMFLSPEEKKYPMIQHRYEKDQYYKPHHDYFSDTFNLKRGGQRIATMLMYLSDNVEGGETYFPMAGSGECSCGGKVVKGLSVKPVQGDAVLFWSMGLDGQSDPSSLHGGCEVLSGEKWSATKWMRQRATS
ncbi:prolyl 4-hydroxylase 1 [Citrus sinensis]|uniref:Prolyl 4-hydroxylase 1 n=1 Tax=Citrus sinensis TaxID=2711 RepID=A0ACB8MEN4_CITSI|nr:prolyl 4-hydroxylase 1 [Citrus sinensis]